VGFVTSRKPFAGVFHVSPKAIYIRLKYIDEGVKLLELAQLAHSLFIRQTAAEKRRLLDYLVSNSIWDGKNLAIEFKQPFDIISQSAQVVELANAQKLPKTTILINGRGLDSQSGSNNL